MRKLFLLIPALAFALMTNATIPSTDFSGGYSFVADDATLEGDIELNTLTANHYLRYIDISPNGTASWEVTVTKPCLVSVTLNMFDNSWNYDANDDVKKLYKNSGHIFKVRILDGETPKDSVAEASESSVYTDIALSGQLYFEKAGTYKVELLNSRAWSKCGISGITLTAESIPETDFASAYAFVADDAELSGGNDATKFLLETSVTPHYIRYADHSQPGPVVKWKIHATRACFLNVTLNFADNTAFYSGNKHIMEVQLCNGYENKIDTIAEGPKFDGDGFTENGVDKTLSGTIAIPSAGIYIIKMLNNRNHSKTGIYGITLSYAGGAVQNMPGTTEIDESGYAGGTRAEGKFTIPNGKQNKAWMKWNVAFASSGNYNVFVKINSNNGKKFKVALQDAKGDDIVTPLEKTGGDNGTPVTLEMGSMSVPAGNYTLKLTNNEPWSDAEWISVQFVRAGGGTIDLPTTTSAPAAITFDEVMLSNRAWIDNDSILFTARGDEGHNSSEYAKWNVHSTGGYYKFTANGYNSNMTKDADEKYANGQKYTVTVLSSDETIEKTTKTSSWANPGESSCVTDVVELPEGNYVVKVQNALWGSCGRLMSLYAEYVGGKKVTLQNNTVIPFGEAILSANATRSLSPAEIHFNGVAEYAQWNVAAAAGIYTFTLNVTGTNYGKYQLDIIGDNVNIHPDFVGKDGSGTVTISNIFIPADGDYVLQLANINSGADGYITSVTVTVADNIFIVDENATDGSYIVEGISGKKPLLNRSFSAGRYYTLCVPFDSYNGELESIFGTDYELWKMESAEQSGEGVSLIFSEVAHDGNNFVNSTPYIIKPSKDVVNPLFGTHTIHSSNTTQAGAAANFVGTFYKDVIPAGDKNLYLQNNELYYNENNDTPIKGTRAWVHLNTVNAAAARIVLGGKVATGITLVDGELVDGTIKTIENGQLVIIRDGVRYNAQGQLIRK